MELNQILKEPYLDDCIYRSDAILQIYHEIYQSNTRNNLNKYDDIDREPIISNQLKVNFFNYIALIFHISGLLLLLEIRISICTRWPNCDIAPECDSKKDIKKCDSKRTSYQYRKSHCGEKTIVGSSYLHNRIFYTDKTSSYWISALVIYGTNTKKNLNGD